jgi:hypothetical protein
MSLKPQDALTTESPVKRRVASTAGRILDWGAPALVICLLVFGLRLLFSPRHVQPNVMAITQGLASQMDAQHGAQPPTASPAPAGFPEPCPLMFYPPPGSPAAKRCQIVDQ